MKEVNHLRYLAKHDPKYGRLLAIELVHAVNECVEHGRDLEALSLAEEAVVGSRRSPRSSQEPDDLLLTALMHAGCALVRLGRHQEAEPYLREAVSLAPATRLVGDSIGVHALSVVALSLCRERADDTDEALALANRVLDLANSQTEPNPVPVGAITVARLVRNRLASPPT